MRVVEIVRGWQRTHTHTHALQELTPLLREQFLINEKHYREVVKVTLSVSYLRP